MPRVAVDGYEIFYEKHGKKTELPPLIFLHGIGSSTLAWKEQLNFFKNYTEVHAYDQLGHGRSAKPKINYEMPLLARILRGFIKELNIKDPVVVGHSMGGFIVQVFSLMYPTLPKKIVLACTGPKIFIDLPVNLLIKLRVPILKIHEWIYYKLYHLQNKAKGSPAKPRAVITNELRSAVSASAQAISSIIEQIVLVNISKMVPRIKKPVLFVSAGKDPFLKFASFYKETLNAEIFIIKGGEHTPFEPFKDQFNPVLLRFLQKT